MESAEVFFLLTGTNPSIRIYLNCFHRTILWCDCRTFCLIRMDIFEKIEKSRKNDCFLAIFGLIWLCLSHTSHTILMLLRTQGPFGCRMTAKFYENRPLRGTRLFLLLYPFRSKKNDSQKNYFQDKKEVSKSKK